MSLYPSLEDMKVDQMAQAQVILVLDVNSRQNCTGMISEICKALEGILKRSTVVGFLDVWKLHFDIYTNER